MDVSKDVAAIVAKAPEWNFAGDCDLLKVMKRISQNLQERGERTTENLREFEINVRRADIALDNATNSLRSLQFGQQFVEYRVEEVEDDDFMLPENEIKKPEPPAKSSEEMAKEFLKNNLDMFRKNFEPVTLEVPDSDDEEDAAANRTTVYRAKNPYDVIPLPYIIGSQQWEAHKYAGLYDSAENSEDDQPEQFSSSSSDEQEMAAAKTTPKKQLVETQQQSDSSSVASLPKLEVPTVKAPTILVPPVPERARAQPRPIISSRRNPHESDLFTAMRASPPSDDPPSTSSSLNSSPAISTATGLPHVDASLSSSSSSASKFMKQTTPPKLFEAAAPASVPAAVAAVAAPAHIEREAKAAPNAASQIKKRPVNIFNDDEFNSFMSEIADKVQSKTGNNSTLVEAAKETPKIDTPKSSKIAAAKQELPKQTPTRNLNLFDDSPPLSPQASPAFKATVPAKSASVLPKSLFDDNLEDDDDFLGSFTPKAKPQQQIPKTSLFDDDDDDLDIDDIFTKKAPINKLPNTIVEKTTVSLFADDEDESNPNDIFAGGKAKPPMASTVHKQKSLFDDLGEDDLFGTPKSNKNVFVGANAPSQRKTLSGFVEAEPPEDVRVLPVVPKANKVEKQPDKQTVEGPEEQLETVSKITQMKTDSTSQVDLFSEDFSDDEAQEQPKKQIVEDQLEKNETGKILEEDLKTKISTPKAKEQPVKKPQDLTMPETNLPKLSTENQQEKVGDQVDKIGTKETLKEPFKAGNPTFTANLYTEDFSEGEAKEPKFMEPEKQIIKDQAEQSKKEITKINIPKVDLFSDEFSDDEPSLSSASKTKAENISEIIEEPTDKEIETEDSVLDDFFENLKETPENAALPQEQDPIISLVADVTNKKSKADAPPADITAAQQLMQNYSSLFSDEPPDDSEFFQSLGSSSLNSLSTSKIFDSEQDFFEPSLPELPKAAAVATTPAEQQSKDYGGMRLYSDVPPDDDDEDNEIPSVSNALSTKRQEQAVTVAPPTRIHTIFYDDFSETARAGDTIAARLFDEPPSEVPARSAAGNNNQDVPKPPSPIKKLQMPNININVQALLPRSTGAIKKETKKQADVEAPESSPGPTVKTAKQLVKSSSSDTDSILQCISKTRVRGPARRPSTRRARQENYERTLLEQNTTEVPKQQQSESLAKLVDAPKIVQQIPKQSHPSPPIVETKTAPRKVKKLTSFLDSEDKDADAALFNPPKAATQPSTQNNSNSDSNTTQIRKKFVSFLDSEDDDDTALFNPPSIKEEIAKIFPKIPRAVEKAAPQATQIEPPKTTTKTTSKPKKLTSFLDSENKKDTTNNTLINPPKSLPKKAVSPPMLSQKSHEDKSQSTAIAPKATKQASLFLDSDEDEDDALFSSATKPLPVVAEKPLQTIKAKATAPAAVPQPKAIPASSSKLFDDSDDDDLFSSNPVPVSKAKSTAGAVQPKAATAASSLFQGESEKEEPSKSKLKTKSKLPAKPSKSLFSDDEDDDDLFGGGAAAARPKQATSQPKTVHVASTATRNIPKNPPNKNKSTPMPSNTSDNPLADLLGP